MRTIFHEGTTVKLIDQTRLPHEMVVVECQTLNSLCEAIRTMRIRGAPALGVAAAYGMALAAEEAPDQPAAFTEAMARAAAALRSTRPTAVNLGWGVDQALAALGVGPHPNPSPNVGGGARGEGPVSTARAKLWHLADRLAEQDILTNRRMGEHGAALIPDGARILTHCNAGGLATVSWGTALGVVRSAFRGGKSLHVYVDETRPFLQGSRLTAWELEQEGIPYTVITDNMAGYFMGQGEVDLCIVGADRIAASGDVANKIGTYSVAVLARAHDLPFYVAAPTSTIDLSLETGAEIPIEERDPAEVLTFAGTRVAPAGASARHPAFDVTPSRYVTAIITEAGICRAPYEDSLRDAVGAGPWVLGAGGSAPTPTPPPTGGGGATERKS